MDRDFAQDLIDTPQRHEDFLNDNASEKAWLQRDVGNVDSLIEPGLRNDVLCLLKFVVDVKFEGGGGIWWFGSNEESVMVRIWIIGTGVESEVQTRFVTHDDGWRWDLVEKKGCRARYEGKVLGKVK